MLVNSLLSDRPLVPRANGITSCQEPTMSQCVGSEPIMEIPHYVKSQRCPIVSNTIIWSEHPIVPRARGVPCCGEPMYCQNVLFSHEPTICHCPRSHLSVELSLYAGSQQYSIVPGISMFSKWPIISGASNVPLS